MAGGQELECRLEVPACARLALLEEAQAGRAQAQAYTQAARLGAFYLEQAFSLSLLERDEEDRSLAHYLVWLGEDVALSHLLSVWPLLANMVARNSPPSDIF